MSFTVASFAGPTRGTPESRSQRRDCPRRHRPCQQSDETHENCPRNAVRASRGNARETVSVRGHGEWVVDGVSGRDHNEVNRRGGPGSPLVAARRSTPEPAAAQGGRVSAQSRVRRRLLRPVRAGPVTVRRAAPPGPPVDQAGPPDPTWWGRRHHTDPSEQLVRVVLTRTRGRQRTPMPADRAAQETQRHWQRPVDGDTNEVTVRVGGGLRIGGRPMTTDQEQQHQQPQRDRSWWTTLPGVLSGIAAVLVAIGGLIGALVAIGVFSGPADPDGGGPPRRPLPRTSPSSPTGTGGRSGRTAC